jgi:hypothetical protein
LFNDVTKIQQSFYLQEVVILNFYPVGGGEVAMALPGVISSNRVDLVTTILAESD